MAQAVRVRATARIAALGVLALAMAYVEASVVVYLRQAMAAAREVHFPDSVREPLPLLSLEQLKQAGPEVESLLRFEVVREVAAVLVLLAAAYGFRRRRGEVAGFFLLGFAVWDIFYYVFLKLMLNWPASLGTWDVLYLIPHPWVAPVWAPLVVSGTLLVIGLIVLSRGGAGPTPGRRAAAAGMLVLVGVGLVLASFFLRADEAMRAVPDRFDWPLFLAGLLVGLAGAACWLARPSTARR
jgi:hypothetical protein